MKKRTDFLKDQAAPPAPGAVPGTIPPATPAPAPKPGNGKIEAVTPPISVEIPPADAKDAGKQEDAARKTP
jgi:hypothetical protein